MWVELVPSRKSDRGALAALLKPKVATAVIGGAVVVSALLVMGKPDSAELAQQPQPTESRVGYVPGVITPVETPSSSSSAPPIPTTNNVVKPPASSPARFTGTAGPGCGGFRGVGTYRDGTKGWVDHGDGRCGSSFVSIPMSGDARRDDSSAFGLWTFTTGAVRTGSCALSVFVPNGDLTEVGGDPTTYRVFDRAEPSGSAIGSFEVDQVEQRGKWVGVGSYRVTDGKLAVQLLTRGVDWNRSGPTHAHHAAAAIKADCTA